MINALNGITKSAMKFTRNGKKFPVLDTDVIVGFRNGILCLESKNKVRRFFLCDDKGNVGDCLKSKFINKSSYMKENLRKVISKDETIKYPDGIRINKITTSFYGENGDTICITVNKTLLNDRRHSQNIKWDFVNKRYQKRTNRPDLRFSNVINTLIEIGKIKKDGRIKFLVKYLSGHGYSRVN